MSQNNFQKKKKKKHRPICVIFPTLLRSIKITHTYSQYSRRSCILLCSRCTTKTEINFEKLITTHPFVFHVRFTTLECVILFFPCCSYKWTLFIHSLYAVSWNTSQSKSKLRYFAKCNRDSPPCKSNYSKAENIVDTKESLISKYIFMSWWSLKRIGQLITSCQRNQPR